MELLQGLFDGFGFGWLLSVPILGAGAAWYFLGGAAVLKILASLIEALTPVVRFLLETVIAGLKDILDNFATIATVALMLYLTYTWQDAKINDLSRGLEQCSSELRIKREKSLGVRKVPTFKIWPFE